MISNIQNIPVVWETSKIFHLHEKYPKYFICMRNKWTMNLTTHDCLNLRIFRQGEHCICSGNGLAMSALYPEMRWGVLLMCCSPTFLDYSAFWMKILVRWESLSFKILPLEVSSTTLCVNKIDKDWIQNPANIFRLAFSPPRLHQTGPDIFATMVAANRKLPIHLFCLFIPFLPGKTSESWPWWHLSALHYCNLVMGRVTFKSSSLCRKISLSFSYPSLVQLCFPLEHHHSIYFVNIITQYIFHHHYQHIFRTSHHSKYISAWLL